MSGPDNNLRRGLRIADRRFADERWWIHHRAIVAARSLVAAQRLSRTVFGVLLSLSFPLAVGCHNLSAKSDVIRIDGAESKHGGEAAYRLAMHAYTKGHLNQATEKLEKVVRLNPRHASAQNNLGIIYYQQRKLALAASHFDLARELLPDSPLPLNNLGMTFEAGGRVMEAIDYYERASELAPENPLYLGNLLRARLRLGERNEAIIDRLRYLAFIETRPDWVAWIDEQLAIHLNPNLDRGPSVDEENALGKTKQEDEGVYRGTISDTTSTLEIIESDVDDFKFRTPEWSDSAEPLPVPAPLDSQPKLEGGGPRD